MSHIFTAMRRLVEDIEELGGPGELAREIVHDWVGSSLETRSPAHSTVLATHFTFYPFICGV